MVMMVNLLSLFKSVQLLLNKELDKKESVKS